MRAFLDRRVMGPGVFQSLSDEYFRGPPRARLEGSEKALWGVLGLLVDLSGVRLG